MSQDAEDRTACCEAAVSRRDERIEVARTQRPAYSRSPPSSRHGAVCRKHPRESAWRAGQCWHRQDAHAATIDELISNEVERPAVVRPLRDQHRRPRAQSSLAAAPPADHETLLAIEPEERADVDSRTADAHAPTLAGAAAVQRRPVGSTDTAPSSAGTRSSCTPAARSCRTQNTGERQPLACSGRHHFFASRSFSAALSSMASANSFFNLAFSLSSPFRRASETSSRRIWSSSCRSSPR
jgi:hypothetical protein